MNFEELAIGWREALLGVVVLLVAYVFFVVIRLRRLKQAASADALASENSRRKTGLEPREEQGPVPLAPNELPFPWNEPPPPPPPPPEPGSDAERLMVVELEITELRKEVAVMRDELLLMREELSEQLDRVQSAQHVAPVYGDAMQMAVAGYDAQAIAERCGVARAEAELVVALVRNAEEVNDDEPSAMSNTHPIPAITRTRMRER